MKARVLPVAAAAAAAVLLGAASPGADTDGSRWSYTLDLHADEANGQPLAKPEQRRSSWSSCDALTTRAGAERALGSALPGCRIDDLRTTGGTLTLAVACAPDREGMAMAMAMDATGPIDATSLHLAVHVVASDADDRAVMSGTLSGVRGGRCVSGR